MSKNKHKYEKARELAHRALENLHSRGQERATGQELLAWIRKHHKSDLPLVEKSWGTFLTRMLDDPESHVIREPGRYGYKLEMPTPDPVHVPEEESAQQVEASPAKSNREQRLYALLAEWLEAKDYQAEDTSSSKKGGAWGNPDVVGIRCFEGFSSTLHLELVSVEAKLTDFNWRRVFFEAVSHKRFADRAYFAFSHGASEPSVQKLPEFQELREYGEKYRVGILVVFMEPDIHRQLCEATASALPNLSLENVRVEEVWPAVSDPVQAATRERFMREVLDINTLHQLHKFGS
ncbi:hypothetical protein [Caldimonas sp.]|uniref:hypothetical protein n=1 Tax=Caldimonas sp. TaxID=2838790 RepID=UPI003919041B